MKTRRWLVVTPGFLMVLALTCGAAGAADKTKVIGNTVVEGAKFSGQTIKEFFTSKQ
jgi:hypothetical protein